MVLNQFDSKCFKERSFATYREGVCSPIGKKEVAERICKDQISRQLQIIDLH